ncbi:CKLF-like MARVEL transmembrane domain-containing protein 5 isoform X2 [Emydura macquarii macquarii]|uniref:CKLF-like MARVEL transmembrane domain-containing protein 5 isoform X2 n=1 Tax=Emydura macquarii macquarii TaxID=1129001 RepID=UPI00352B35AD
MREAVAPGGLRDRRLDWQFLRSTKGALLGTELDFLRAASAALIFLVVSPAAIATSRDGPAASAFTFSLILIGVFAYDAFSTYRAEIRPEPSQDANGDLP